MNGTLIQKCHIYTVLKEYKDAYLVDEYEEAITIVTNLDSSRLTWIPKGEIKHIRRLSPMVLRKSTELNNAI